MAVYSHAQNLFEADFASGNIYEFTPQGVQSTFASGLGAAMPFDLAFNQAGDLFLTEYQTNQIYVFTPGGMQSTFPASGLSFPRGMAFDQSSNLFVADPGNGNIYKFTPAGVQTTFASGLDPWALAFDQAGDLFEADSYSGTINEFTTNGVQTTFASGLNSPMALAFDQAGDLFEADQGSGAINEFTTNGVQTTFASGLLAPSGLAFDGAGDLFESDQGSGHIFEFQNINGMLSPSPIPFASLLGNPIGLAFGPAPELSTAPSQGQFLWSERIASANSWPESEPNTGLALDTHDNCFVTGFFDDTNNFGGVTLTNQSTGGSDIFVAKYNSAGALQWAQRAGGGAGNFNYGRGIGMDTNGNIYVAGGYQSPATFGGISLPATSGEEFFLAKYNSAGAVQWVQPSTGGSDDVYGIGLTVDGAGNSYALLVVDDLGGAGGSITFGSTIVAIPANGGTTMTVLVKYDNTGAAQWAQLFASSQESYATRIAVDTVGNVYVRGLFESDMTIGGSSLTVSPANDTKNMFIAKFNSSGALTWVQQPTGGNVGEGGVAVDPAGNVFVSGYFDTNLVFGGGITLTNMADSSALFGDAFLAMYNSAGAIQWAQPAGGTNGGFYWDLALDAQTNVYAAGFLGSDAAVAKYSPAGTLQWTYSASGPPASPVSSGVAKCAVDSAGNCYLNGFYHGTATFGTNTLQSQETWNFFLAEVAPSVITTNVTIQTTDASFGVRTNHFGFDITGASGTVVVVEASTNLVNPVWIPVSTNTLTGGSSYFSDPQWMNYSGRFYRISSP